MTDSEHRVLEESSELLDHLSISRFEAAVAIFSEFYPGDTLSAKSKRLLQAALDRNAGRSVAGIDGDLRVSTPAEPDLEQASDAVRDLWFIATTDPVRHIASTMIDFDTLKTRCGKVLDIEWAQMGRGRPTASKSDQFSGDPVVDRSTTGANAVDPVDRT